ncbi:MAG: hypothetical protein ACLFVE_11060 [Chitinispirillaceae bacterium]
MLDKKDSIVTVQKVIEAGQDHILLLNSDKKLWIARRTQSGSAEQPTFLVDDVFHVAFSKDSVAVLLENGDSLVAQMNDIRKGLANNWKLSAVFRKKEIS